MHRQLFALAPFRSLTSPTEIAVQSDERAQDSGDGGRPQRNHEVLKIDVSSIENMDKAIQYKHPWRKQRACRSKDDEPSLLRDMHNWPC